jgi:hypothetical protein
MTVERRRGGGREERKGAKGERRLRKGRWRRRRSSNARSAHEGWRRVEEREMTMELHEAEKGKLRYSREKKWRQAEGEARGVAREELISPCGMEWNEWMPHGTGYSLCPLQPLHPHPLTRLGPFLLYIRYAKCHSYITVNRRINQAHIPPLVPPGLRSHGACTRRNSGSDMLDKAADMAGGWRSDNDCFT